MRSAARLAPFRSLLAWLSFALCGGCGLLSGVDVKPIATSFQKPSNVAAYVAVSDGSEPLIALQPQSFHVYENEQLVPPEQAQLKLLDRRLAAAHHALLLVDLSAAATPEARTLLAKAVQNFAQKVVLDQGLSVLAFDGRVELQPIAELGRGQSVPPLSSLERSFSSRDSSRNLNGAVVSALERLSERLERSGKVVKVGTLVVFTSGPDSAGRVDDGALRTQLAQTAHDVLAIGVGDGADSLSELGRRGVIRAQSADTLPIAFAEAGMKAANEYSKHYLISYCSPARAGVRRLRVEVGYTTMEGEERRGNFETEFDAKGFGPGCNPATSPRFIVQPKPEPSGGDARPLRPTAPAAPNAGEPASDPSAEDAPVAPPPGQGYAK